MHSIANLTTDDVAARLDAESPKTFDVTPIETTTQNELPDVMEFQELFRQMVSQQTQLLQTIGNMEERFVSEIAAARVENAELREYISDRLEERDRQLTETMRKLLENRQEEARPKKGWWLALEQTITPAKVIFHTVNSAEGRFF